MISSNQQQPSLQYVDIVDGHEIWSGGRKRHCVTLDVTSVTHCIVCQTPFLLTCCSGLVIPCAVWKWFSNMTTVVGDSALDHFTRMRFICSYSRFRSKSLCKDYFITKGWIKRSKESGVTNHTEMEL